MYHSFETAKLPDSLILIMILSLRSKTDLYHVIENIYNESTYVILQANMCRGTQKQCEQWILQIGVAVSITEKILIYSLLFLFLKN